MLDAIIGDIVGSRSFRQRYPYDQHRRNLRLSCQIYSEPISDFARSLYSFLLCVFHLA